MDFQSGFCWFVLWFVFCFVVCTCLYYLHLFTSSSAISRRQGVQDELLGEGGLNAVGTGYNWAAFFFFEMMDFV